MVRRKLASSPGCEDQWMWAFFFVCLVDGSLADLRTHVVGPAAPCGGFGCEVSGDLALRGSEIGDAGWKY